MRLIFARMAASVYIFGLYLLLPLLPILATLIFGKPGFTLRYRQTLQKILVHIAALRQGPAVHFFHDILGQVYQVPEEIQGECVQCGNCCMNKQCVFLEKTDDQKFICGIYHSPLRKLSNCGSFPINGHDIERYACPSYFVTAPQAQTIRWMPQTLPVDASPALKN